MGASNGNEQFINRRLPPIHMEINRDHERINNLEMAPVPINPLNDNGERFTFVCRFLKKDLSKKIEAFIKEIKEQDIFYNKKSDDDLYNQLKIKEWQILKEKYNTLKDGFLQQIIKQFTQELPTIDYEKITKEVIKHENGTYFLTNKIKKYISEIENNEENFKVKHITILLVGKSGVGKSTLCNNLLRLPENKKALTDIGKPVTQKSNIYSDPKVSFLKVIDTAGIEIHGANKIENVIKVCRETIDTQVKSLDKNDMVSCIFYCFTGSRIEDEEVEFLDELINSLEGNNIPFLYVYTQAVRQSAIDGMKECIENETRLGKVEFVPVLAEDFDLIDKKYLKSYGLDIILEKAIKTIKNNIKSNLFEERTKEISVEIIKYFKKKNRQIKDYSIEQMYLHYLTNLKVTLNKEELIKFLLEIIEKCFIFFIEPSEITSFNKNSINVFKNTFKNYIEKCYDLFDKACTNAIDNFKEIQAGRFLDEQAKLEKRGKNIKPNNIRELNDFKKIIDDFFRRNFIFIAEKNFIKFFISDIYENLCQKNEEYCNEIIDNLIVQEISIKDAINKCFITKYKNIENKIDEYKIGYKQNIYGRIYV